MAFIVLKKPNIWQLKKPKTGNKVMNLLASQWSSGTASHSLLCRDVGCDMQMTAHHQQNFDRLLESHGSPWMFSATKLEGLWPFQSDMGMCLGFQWTIGSTGTPEMQVLLSKGPWSALSWWDSPAFDVVLWCGQVPHKLFWTAWRGVCVVIRDSWKKKSKRDPLMIGSIYLFIFIQLICWYKHLFPIPWWVVLCVLV